MMVPLLVKDWGSGSRQSRYLLVDRKSWSLGDPPTRKNKNNVGLNCKKKGKKLEMFQVSWKSNMPLWSLSTKLINYFLIKMVKSTNWTKTKISIINFREQNSSALVKTGFIKIFSLSKEFVWCKEVFWSLLI